MLLPFGVQVEVSYRAQASTSQNHFAAHQPRYPNQVVVKVLLTKVLLVIHATPAVKGCGVIAALFRLLRSLRTEVSAEGPWTEL